MEHLSLQDREQGPLPPNMALVATQGPGPLQLPPQMFTTATQLLDLTDKKLVLVLRDGRKIIGVLRSWDQFANLVLQDTVERIFIRHLYADVRRGTFLVRGENVLLLGEIDLDKDDYVPPQFTQTSMEEIFSLQKEEATQRKKMDKVRKMKMAELGFEGEHSGEVLF